MPTAGQWTKFLVSAGGFLGMGVYTVTKLMPTDEEIIAKLSPELKERYYREKEIRHRADQIFQERISAQAQTKGTPAWLQGSAKMREFERSVIEQARAEIEQRQRNESNSDQIAQLRALAEKERKL